MYEHNCMSQDVYTKHAAILILTISDGGMQSTSVAMEEAVGRSGWMMWCVRAIFLQNSAHMLDGGNTTVAMMRMLQSTVHDGSAMHQLLVNCNKLWLLWGQCFWSVFCSTLYMCLYSTPLEQEGCHQYKSHTLIIHGKQIIIMLPICNRMITKGYWNKVWFALSTYIAYCQLTYEIVKVMRKILLSPGYLKCARNNWNDCITRSATSNGFIISSAWESVIKT